MPNEYFTNSQELSSMANAIRRKTGSEASIEWKAQKGFADAVDSIWDTTVYGFHINSNESDPSDAVTYLADAIGKNPAHMDYTNSVFDYGSWENAFFMPRPCMLKYDGTVDYYLDPNDYSKKLDGTASDVADDTYGGNAMMEWGQNGKKIWYKIVPDENDDTSASIYISDHQADEGFRAWSFINNQGVMADHFYTPIYNGSLDANGKLRSISGKTYSDLCQSKTASEEVTAAELNNPSADKLWYTEVYADVTLINILLILIGKSLNCQTVFGNGVQGQTSAASSMVSTGTLDDKGLFFGYDDPDHAVKVFGMENWWGNQWRRYAGHVMIDYVNKYKMTRGRQDGSTSDDYVQSNSLDNYSGYLIGATSTSSYGYAKKMKFDENGFQPYEIGGTSSTYWCDYWYVDSPNIRYSRRGGDCANVVNQIGAFYLNCGYTTNSSGRNTGVALSCKPLAPSEQEVTE